MRRFYKSAAAAPTSGKWAVLLDGKPIKTPAKAPLEVPTKALAEAIAGEWLAQGDKVKPKSMPLMRLACTAIDRVQSLIDGVVDEIAVYGQTDMLCYRAPEPTDLADLQAKLWQPWLDWAVRKYGADLIVTQGLGAVQQPPEALAALRHAVAAFDPYRLIALHALVAGYGSLVLGLAVMDDAAAPEAAWEAARCDQAFQEARWGIDPEALARTRNLKADIDAAIQFAALLKT